MKPIIDFSSRLVDSWLRDTFLSFRFCNSQAHGSCTTFRFHLKRINGMKDSLRLYQTPIFGDTIYLPILSVLSFIWSNFHRVSIGFHWFSSCVANSILISTNNEKRQIFITICVWHAHDTLRSGSRAAHFSNLLFHNTFSHPDAKFIYEMCFVLHERKWKLELGRAARVPHNDRSNISCNTFLCSKSPCTI